MRTVPNTPCGMCAFAGLSRRDFPKALSRQAFASFRGLCWLSWGALWDTPCTTCKFQQLWRCSNHVNGNTSYCACIVVCHPHWRSRCENWPNAANLLSFDLRTALTGKHIRTERVAPQKDQYFAVQTPLQGIEPWASKNASMPRATAPRVKVMHDASLHSPLEGSGHRTVVDLKQAPCGPPQTTHPKPPPDLGFGHQKGSFGGCLESKVSPSHTRLISGRRQRPAHAP